MNPTAFIEVLIGAFLTALFSIYINVTQKKNDTWKDKTSAFLVVYQGIAAVGLIAIALLTDTQVIKSSLPDFLWPLLITGICNIAFQYLFARAHAIEEVSLVSPILASTPTILVLSSMLILHEYPSALGWFGIWLVAVGGYSLNLHKLREKWQQRGSYDPVTWRGKIKQEAKIWLAPILALRESKGVRLAFIAAMIGAVSLNYDGLVARHSNVMFGLGCTLLIVVAGHLPIAIFRREFKTLNIKKGFWTGPLLLALLYASAISITNLAFRTSLVAYVGSLKRVSIPITIVLAYFLLKERTNFKDRLLGGLLIMIGVICISLA